MTINNSRDSELAAIAAVIENPKLADDINADLFHDDDTRLVAQRISSATSTGTPINDELIRSIQRNDGTTWDSFMCDLPIGGIHTMSRDAFLSVMGELRRHAITRETESLSQRLGTISDGGTVHPQKVAEMLRESEEKISRIQEVDWTNSTNSTSSTGLSLNRTHPVPSDSILQEYLEVVRCVSEAPDSWLIAPVLSLCGRLLTPNVQISLGTLKPMTIYNFIAGPAGLRKSTSFNPAEILAYHLLDDSDLIQGNVSDSSLFQIFEENPNRLQFEDDGNTILTNWASTTYGKEVSSRYLKLYDGGRWEQSFRNAQGKKDDTPRRVIERATLSLAIGSTFGVAQFNGINQQSGLRRRFGYYVATRSERMLEWPSCFNVDDHQDLAERFAKLRELSGCVSRQNFTNAAQDVWRRIQAENRTEAESQGCTAMGEIMAASLNETPARIFKLAVIFQACRWAAGIHDYPLTIEAEILEMAEAHQRACLDAGRQLETVGRRGAIEDEADSILACIRADFSKAPYLRGNAIYLDKTALTRRFASNPGRSNSLTPERLYGDIIQALIVRGEAREHSRDRKRVVYAFRRF
jgi:hypothetical protein